MSPPARRALVDRADPALPIVAQCRLLKVARSTLYYRPVPVSADDLAADAADGRAVSGVRRSTDRAAWWRCCGGTAGR